MHLDLARRLTQRLFGVRPLRFGATSVVAFALAQAGLALAYGVLRWPVPSAVAFSFALSAGPAYVLSRRLVWPDGCDARASGGEAARFLTVAALGAATSLGVVWAATGLAQRQTSDHLTLSVVANLASIGATGVTWVGRYLALDRLVFARPRAEGSVVRGGRVVGGGA